jgi:hypothetical protein
MRSHSYANSPFGGEESHFDIETGEVGLVYPDLVLNEVTSRL